VTSKDEFKREDRAFMRSLNISLFMNRSIRNRADSIGCVTAFVIAVAAWTGKMAKGTDRIRRAWPCLVIVLLFH
jgi:hypothetical protein